MDHSNLLKNFGSIMVSKARHEYPLEHIHYMEEVVNRGKVYNPEENYIRFNFSLSSPSAPGVIMSCFYLDGRHHSWCSFKTGELPQVPNNDPDEEEPLSAA